MTGQAIAHNKLVALQTYFVLCCCCCCCCVGVVVNWVARGKRVGLKRNRSWSVSLRACRHFGWSSVENVCIDGCDKSVRFVSIYLAGWEKGSALRTSLNGSSSVVAWKLEIKLSYRRWPCAIARKKWTQSIPTDYIIHQYKRCCNNLGNARGENVTRNQTSCRFPPRLRFLARSSGHFSAGILDGIKCIFKHFKTVGCWRSVSSNIPTRV